MEKICKWRVNSTQKRNWIFLNFSSSPVFTVLYPFVDPWVSGTKNFWLNLLIFVSLLKKSLNFNYSPVKRRMCVEIKDYEAKLARLNKMFENSPQPIKNLVKLIRTDPNGYQRVSYSWINLNWIWKSIFLVWRKHHRKSFETFGKKIKKEWIFGTRKGNHQGGPQHRMRPLRSVSHFLKRWILQCISKPISTTVI